MAVHTFGLWLAQPRDRCARCRSDVVGGIDLHGRTVCYACLRALDADPSAKRRILLNATVEAFA